MFKPTTLWETIELARMRDERLSREKILLPHQLLLVFPAMTPLHCFNCDKRFSSGHKCRAPILLMIEDIQSTFTVENVMEKDVNFPV